MTNAAFNKAIAKAARRMGRKYLASQAGKTRSTLTQPNAVGMTEGDLGGFVKWAHDEHILGKSFAGDVNVMPEMGRALIGKQIKKPIPLQKDVDVLGFYATATRLGFSPAYAGERFFGVHNNPVREATDALMVRTKALVEHKRWFNALIGKDKFGIGSFVPDNHKSIGEAAVSLLETNSEGKLLGKTVKKQLHTWYKMSSAMEKGAERVRTKFLKAQTTAESVALFKKLNKIEQVKREADVVWKKPFEEFAEKSSRKYPEARIAYFAEGHPEWPWLDPLLDEREKKVGLLVRKFMQNTRQKLVDLDIPVLPSETGYMTHLATEMPRVRNKFFLSGRRQGMKQSLDFAHRSPGSVMWFPSLNEIMDYYMGAATKKIAFQPFHQRWAATKNSWLKAGQKGEILSDWWKSWYDQNYKRIGTDFEGKIGKLGNFWVRSEYIRLIGFSLSVGLKHLFKAFGTAIVHGPVSTGRAIVPTTKAAYDLARKTFHNASPLGPEAQLAERYIQSRISMQSIFETPGMKRASLTLEKLAGNPTMAVEAFDRGVNLYATIFAGMQEGASYETIHKGILDYIMKVNFVGGFDQFGWMKTPGRRAFFMFQMTPAKIWQFRYKLVEDALLNLKTKGKKGKDIFGRSTGPMVVRALMMYGLAEAWARQYDMSLMDHIVHFPFTKHTREGEVTIAKPPIIDFVFNLVENHGLSGEGMTLALRDHYNWLGIASKIKIIGDEKYPHKYETDVGPSKATRLMLALPSKKKTEELEEYRRKQKQLRDIKRLRKRQITGTLYPKKLDKMIEDMIRD